MSNDQATAVLALAEANKAMELAREAFTRMGDGDSVELLNETIDDNATIIEAIVAKARAHLRSEPA